jgi:K+-transporting ATPase c subunit
VVACNSYTWIDGVTYSASTTSPQVTLTAANGCDSIVSLDLTIDSSLSSTDQVVACNSYTWIDGVTYSASTTSPQVTLTAANGCDSRISPLTVA